jgi:hypothetical protein
MAVKVGAAAVTMRLGTQGAKGYLGSTLVATAVPGAPTITSAFYDAGAPEFLIRFIPPNDGGSPITGYKFYVDGVEEPVTLGGPNPYNGNANDLLASFTENFNGSDIQVSALNAIGEGPRSVAVTAPINPF